MRIEERDAERKESTMGTGHEVIDILTLKSVRYSLETGD